MMLLTSIVCFFLASCSAAPSTKQNIVVTENFFSHGSVLYTGKHDIVRIFVPFNQFNFEDNSIEVTSSSSSEEIEHPHTLFFVEGDFKNEQVVYQGLYIFKDGKATKILDNGRDATATRTNTIYLGAKDGIYKYDNATNTATKHGTVTDSISQLAHNNKTNSIYYLTDDYEVYKLNDDATASVKVPSLVDVQEMAFGFEGKLYYYNSNKEFYVVDIEGDGVQKKIKGLPANMNKTVLISPMYGMEDGAILYVDKIVYSLKSDQAEKLRIRMDVPLTAQAPQPTLIQFYAKDKKIYEFNIILIMLSNVFEGLREALNDYQDVISSVRKSSF
ncbi:hypothetical protein MSG28_014218 [Choristoneura fumiferana]|uniref:Uncharacterized protein n=1 Tax=Choristoneura fumiferana TaxID=7141 RepID=A0ACC0JGE8_CHOFU|nr:hypothetical protein MSG28_014218 [Choristoneura fumiferana]